MRNPVSNGKITALFDQQRPLNGPFTHVHGAIDIAAKRGTPIVAPEDGVLFGYIAHRSKDGEYWGDWPRKCN